VWKSLIPALWSFVPGKLVSEEENVPGYDVPFFFH
jgi:hypothetical protein